MCCLLMIFVSFRCFSLLSLDLFWRSCIHRLQMTVYTSFLTTLGSTGRKQANQRTKYYSIETWGRTQYTTQHIKTNQLVSTCWFFLYSIFFLFFFFFWLSCNNVNHNPGGTCRKSAFNTQNMKKKQLLVHKKRCINSDISSLWSLFVIYFIYFDVHYYSLVVVKYFYMCCLYY